MKFFYVYILILFLLPALHCSENKKCGTTIALINKTDAPIEIKTKFKNEEIYYGQIAAGKKFDISASRHYVDSPLFHVFVQYKNSAYGWQDISLSELKKSAHKTHLAILIKPAHILGIPWGLSCETEIEPVTI
jgi:hypothetical protein